MHQCFLSLIVIAAVAYVRTKAKPLEEKGGASRRLSLLGLIHLATAITATSYLYEVLQEWDREQNYCYFVLMFSTVHPRSKA